MSDFDSLEEKDPASNIGFYSGGRNDLGQRHGVGEATLKNGDEYVGEYCDGKRHGYGKYRFKDGSRYEGYYSCGRKQGDGTFIYPDGSKYKGKWVTGKRHGYGKYTYANGDWYEGDWKDDMKDGQGVYFHKHTSTKFEGTWSDGRRDGHAEFVNAHYSYQGGFLKGVPQGAGTMSFPASQCQQRGEFILTDVFVRHNGMLETQQEATWRCTELVDDLITREDHA